MNERLHIAYCCHDPFPCSDTNTQQIFWTLAEVTRLNVGVDLFVPFVAIDGARDARSAVAAHYGCRGEISPLFTITPLANRAPAGSLGRGWFDWQVPRHLAARSYPLVWTRDPLAALSCARAGLAVIFETYRADFATRKRFAAWRRACLTSPHLRGVIAHSRLTADAFARAGIEPERCLVAHNGVAPTLVAPPLDRATARARLGLPADGPLVVYAGNVGRHKGTDALVRMAAAVQGARFLLVGVNSDSGEARQIEEAARSAGATNLLLRSRVPLAEVAPYLYAADCLVIPPTEEPLRRFGRTVLPMKVFMYLAVGRPILAPRLPDLEEVLTDGTTACLVAPDDIDRAAEVLMLLLGDHALQEHLSQQALAAADRYTWGERAKRVVAFLTATAASASSRR